MASHNITGSQRRIENGSIIQGGVTPTGRAHSSSSRVKVKEVGVRSRRRTPSEFRLDFESTFEAYFGLDLFIRVCAVPLWGVLCVSNYSVKNRAKLDLKVGPSLPNNRKR